MGAQSSTASGAEAEKRQLEDRGASAGNETRQGQKKDVVNDGEEEDDDEEEEEEEEEDEWDKRIFSTGCAEENDRMRDCHLEKKDWRLCIEEMEQFKRCWKAHGNEERTGQKNIS